MASGLWRVTRLCSSYNEYLRGKVPSFSRYMHFLGIQKLTHNEKSIHKTMIRQLTKSTLENMTCVKHSREHDLWKAL